MNKMAVVAPNYTLYFSKDESSFEDAANAFLKAVGPVDRLGNSLVGKNPKYFEKIHDSKIGTTVNLTEEEVKEYKERLLNVYWALWGILNQREYDALEPFMDNFMDEVDVKEEDLDRFREILLRAHQRVRKFKTREELKDFVMYLSNVVYIAEESHRPMISSDKKVLLYVEPASELAWITIEKAKGGRYKVEGGADFVAYPGGIRNTLKSAGYGFKPVTITKLGTQHSHRQG